MNTILRRRRFLQLTIGGTLLSLGGLPTFAGRSESRTCRLISPGCRRSKVKVARLYLGIPKSPYPSPGMELAAERERYQVAFAEMKNELSDVDFLVDEMIGAPEQVKAVKDRLAKVDGILAIQLTIRTMPAMKELLGLGRPTMIFSAPYSGHEWFELSAIRRQKLGKHLECILSTDMKQLAAAIRPFRAIHHLREAKVLNLAANSPKDYAAEVRKKFGTEIKRISRERMLDFYHSVPEAEATAETEQWARNAVAIIEPSHEEIAKSCRLALGFQRLLDDEDATVMTVDCYGSMWRKLPAYPCVGFARLNNLGLGGICQSDLPCALVHILFQSLTGRPGFVCNPTLDFATDSATLIHCLGTPRMDGPNQPAAPYKLRSVMEREEGAVPQVKMRLDQPVTAAMFDGTSALRYFTGRIVDTPETERGCRTKITVKLNGSAERLWQNWTAGIHRVACYGEISKELAHFCRFMGLNLINEAA